MRRSHGEATEALDDGNRITASGVSAGMDMALHLIKRLWGEDLAERIAQGTEYDWHRDPSWDPFSTMYGE